MGLPTTSDYIQIKIKMPNPSREYQASFKAPNQDLKDMDVLCTLKIKIENQNSEMGFSKTSYHMQIKIQMPTPIQEPLTSLKT